MTIIASSLILSPKAIKAHKLTDTYSLHRLVYGLFEDVRSDSEKIAGLSSGIQFAEVTGDEFSRKVVVLSNRMPIEGKNLAGVIVQTRAIDEKFTSHDLYTFKVIVNPVRRDSRSRQFIPVKTRSEIELWFIDRAISSLGFEVIHKSIDISKVEVDRFNGKSDNLITLEKAHITGHLRVTDRKAFVRAFALGIGRGRAFGCGLLQIVPITDTLFK